MNNLIKYCFLVLIFFTSNVFTQTTGKLSGRITDSLGEPLISANILVVNTLTGTATDVNGYYSVINLRAGAYSVRVSYMGFQTKIFNNVRISSDRTTQLNVVLESQDVLMDAVMVTAISPIIEFDATSSVSSINKDDIKNLPVQDLSDIVNLKAGVVDGHFRGGRIGEVQYQVDGVSVNNPFSNRSTLQIDRSVIEEVQVISGTFDAKYGQAMSGVVNVVLITGSDQFKYSAEAYFGDYFTTDEGRYPNNNNYMPLRIKSYQLTLSGPVPIHRTTFLISGRRYMNDGYLFGERRFLPTDKSNFEAREFNNTGDGSLVPMQVTDEWSGQFKVTNRSIFGLQISYQVVLNTEKRKNYNHSFRLNPNGIKENNSIGLNHGFSITHSISDKMFYRINLRQNYFNYVDYKFEDLFDQRYLDAGEPKSDANYEDGAIVQGVDIGRYKQNTKSFVAKADFTWQANINNLIEGGLELQYSNVLFGSPGYLIPTNIDGVQILQPHKNVPRLPGMQEYNPIQMAVYLQDRIEMGDIVVRAGIRGEYYDANSTIPSDLANPANSISGAPESLPQETSVKIAIAPRLGVSFPLTSTASAYFSYGHFYQMPALGLLYNNSNYLLLDELQAGGISYGVMGNPDLKPELTIQYEFGFKYGFSPNLGFESAFFHKNISNLLGVEFVSTYTAADYARFTNIDFGSVYGFTLSLTQKNISNFSSSIDYTLQLSEGNSSDPAETANRAASGKDPLPRTIPFNWDQLNTINSTLIYSIPNNFSISTIIKYGSGQPYTPKIGSGFGADLETNSGRKSGFVIIDFRGEKYFKLGHLNLTTFIRVFNLLNTHFANGFVFSDTGSPNYTLTPEASRAQLNNPARFHSPRRIEFGISLRGI